MAGEWLTATANTNMFTYEISPVFILMEHITLKKMREIIGYKGGDSILAPGTFLNCFFDVVPPFVTMGSLSGRRYHFEFVRRLGSPLPQISESQERRTSISSRPFGYVHF